MNLSTETQDVIKRALQERINRLNKVKETNEQIIKNRKANFGKDEVMNAGGGIGVAIQGCPESDKRIIEECEERLTKPGGINQKLNEYEDALEVLESYA